MRNDVMEDERAAGYCNGAGGAAAGDSLELCEECLQVVKQCPPKKRFMRIGCMRPRPIILKPASSSISLDRLVEVALSPTEVCQFPRSPTGKRFPSLSTSGHGEVCDDIQGLTGKKKVASSLPKLQDVGDNILPLDQSRTESTSSKVTRYSLPLEAVQKLKRLSSLDELPLELPARRSSKPVHGDHHAKRFTPRFKSLLDISC